MDIVLIAGLWLGASAWDAVVPKLQQLGHRAAALSLSTVRTRHAAGEDR